MEMVENSHRGEGNEFLSNFRDQKIIPHKRVRSPYLDVMTIHSRQFVCNSTTTKEAHALDYTKKLLIEPIHVSDLEHTGVKFGKDQQKFPMFYPNGTKNANLRHVIQESLQTSLSSGSLPLYMNLHTDSTWDNNQGPRNFDLDESGKDEKVSSRAQRKIQQSNLKCNIAPSPEKRLGTAVSKRNNIRKKNREIDVKTKKLLANLRSNAANLTGLVTHT